MKNKFEVKATGQVVRSDESEESEGDGKVGGVRVISKVNGKFSIPMNGASEGMKDMAHCVAAPSTATTISTWYAIEWKLRSCCCPKCFVCFVTRSSGS